MRIIHFSDIHAGGRLRDLRGLFDKRLFGTLNHLFLRRRSRQWERVARAVTRIRLLAPDIVICTGDLTTLSEPREFEQACEALEPLVTDRRFEFLYVPGNHDHYVRRAKCRHSLRQAFSMLNRKRWELDELPVAFEFQHLRFILVNQAGPCPLYASYGKISAEAEAWLRDHLSGGENTPAVLIGHYPLYNALGKKLPWRRCCRNNAVLQHAFDQGIIRLALCGHIHTPFAREGETGNLEVCAGSLTHSGLVNLVDYNVMDDTLAQRWLSVDNDDEPVPELNGFSALAES